jgi:hypothetical protein
MIGNSVSPVMAEAIFTAIRDRLALASDLADPVPPVSAATSELLYAEAAE